MSRLSLAEVGLRYGDRQALTEVDLEVPAGDMLCLVGPNGAGKSSLLRCVTGLAPAHSGSIHLDGVPLAEYGREALARRIAVVPQLPVLPFAVPVEELVSLGRLPHEHPLRGRRPEDRAAVRRAMERTGVTSYSSRDARELSLGERQMVLIALALAQETPLLILDEPTVHLDLRHQVRVMDLLSELNGQEGRTIIAVLHDLRLAAAFFPRIAVLDGGRLVADGPPSEALSDALIREVFGVDPALVRSSA